MQPDQVTPIPTLPLAPMANGVRVGYACGEHDIDTAGLHHRLFTGNPLDAEGWEGDFPADGYFPTAAERGEVA